MKSIKLLSALALSVTFVGCSSLNQSAPSNALQSSIEAEFSPDIEIGPRVTGRSKTTVIFGFLRFGDSQFADGVNYGVGKPSFGSGAVEEAKSAAAYKALQTSKADLLVAPKYTVDEFNFLNIFRTFDAEVTGFSGKIKSVKQK
jgi:hypothetical protein